MTVKTIAIQTFTKDIKTGAHINSVIEITGQTFTGTVGKLTREFIIHKDVMKTQKNYVLTDVKTGFRVGYLDATSKKSATKEMAINLLADLDIKYGPDRLIQVFNNADLSAGFKPQI